MVVPAFLMCVILSRLRWENHHSAESALNTQEIRIGDRFREHLREQGEPLGEFVDAMLSVPGGRG